MWNLRKLMIPYAYPVMIEYLNKTNTVSKKSESSYFCIKNCQNVNYLENAPFWKKLSLSMWLVRELMIPQTYKVLLEYLKITSIVFKKTESTYF